MNTTSELTKEEIAQASGYDLDRLIAIHITGTPNAVRPYSTDGNAMLAVLERLQKQILNVRIFGGHADEWLVKIWMDPHLVESQSMSLPEAVCRAALLAVLAKKKAEC